MRRPRVFVTGIVSAAVIAAVAVTVPLTIIRSSPAEAAVTAERGELLPPLWDDQQHPFTTVGTSSRYFAYQHDLWSGESDRELKTYDVSDGHVVTDLPVTPVGQYLVKGVSIGNAGGWGYEYLDPSTLASAGTVAAQGTTLCLHNVGVVFRVTANTDTETHLWVQQPDGTKRELDSLPVTPTATFTCVDQDDRHLLVKTDTDLRLIDVQTGAGKTVAAVSPEWAALTPGRVFWRTSASANGQQVAWADRTGQATGSVDVPSTEDPQTLGDDLLAFHKTADYQYEVRRITATDGTVGAPLSTDIRGGTSLDDGSFLAGRVTSLDQLFPDGTRRDVMPLPRARERAWGVGMSGDRVVASWSTSGDQPFSNIPLSETTGGDWTQIPRVQSPDYPFQLSGDVLVTFPKASPTTYTVSWPGGQREIPGYIDDVRLGRGGRLLLALAAGAGDPLQDARTGQGFGTVDRYRTALDGTWVWTGPDSTGTLSGRDVSTGETKTVKTTIPASCESSLQVAGRWALACGVVVDLLGVVPDREPSLGVSWSPVLGNGFVTSLVLHPAQPAELLVTDLNDPDAPSRSYGAASTRGWDRSRRLVAHAGSDDLRFAYIDDAEQVRVAKVDWLKPVPPTTRTDKTAPALTSATAGARTSATQSIAFSYAFTDPTSDVEPGSGVASYDVRYQQRTGSAGSYGDWKEQATMATRITMTAAPNVDTCFQVRATDKAGNVSPWSASQCTQVDGTAPTLFHISAGDRVRTTSSVQLNFSYRDNTQLASYDVVYRTAAAGSSLGQWVFPAGWQKTKATSISLTVGGGTDTCFMVRARDAAGNLSAWSPAICTSLPLDDRSLSIVGSVTRATTAMGIYGTASRLNKSGAGLYRAGQVGNRIAVLALSGPGQGAVDVYHAGYKLGRISLAAPSWSRKVFYLPVTPYRSGTVSIVSVSPAYAWIDGFTALRS